MLAVRSLLTSAFVFGIIVVGAAIWIGAESNMSGGRPGAPATAAEGVAMLPSDDLKLTVVYDNYPCAEGLRAEWGFSCLIEGAQKLVLFDTGGDAPVLLSNMDSLSIDPREIDIVVLSHKHGDHTGGIRALIEVNPDITVFVPESFSGGFKRELGKAGARVIDVREPVEVCEGIYSVGQLGSVIREQSLAISTDRGLVVITGCAHPGIVSIVERAVEVTGRDVLLAMGGFHLGRSTDDALEEVIEGLRAAGVGYAGPCHCSGDRARQLFARAYGDNYVDLGVGAVLRGRDLK